MVLSDTYIIENENSSVHWPFFNTENKNVLDLGCGRWYTDLKEELSPFYFGRNANKVIGVDYNENDINYYKKETEEDSKYVFKQINLNTVKQFKDLIEEYNISALKCDIEGGEVTMLELTKEDFKNITDLAIEYHTEDLKNRFLLKVVEWGFTIDRLANFARTPHNLGVIFCSKH